MTSRIINLKKIRTMSSGALIPNGIDVLEELIAEEGQYITQANDIDIMDRLVLSKVILGKNHSKEEWKDISSEEASDIKNEQQRIIEEEERKRQEEENEELVIE